MDIKNYLLNYYIETNGEKLTPELAKCIVKEFAITDGSDRQDGEKWNMGEAQQIAEKISFSLDRVSLADFYTVLNMMYSDYYGVGKKHGLTDWQLYAELAAAWFNDVDGKENKTFSYFFSM